VSDFFEAVAQSIRADEDAEGHPGGCDFQAGFYQCPNRWNRYALRPICRIRSGHYVYGWECRDCGTWYPRRERGE
jgi:hypothetical protein